MAEKLTPQQKEAVFNRGGKLLVSAAAGSGKTKVLVDRLMSYLMDEKDPANLDDFLIITYTKAAASELRGKIAAKLTERIAQDPSNRHLQRQLQRLYLTKISTVHAFCGDILRQYAYKLDLPADFRVADENECLEIRIRVMEKVLNDAYDAVGEEPDIQAFVETQGLGRSDALLPDILFKVYDSARCHLNPEQWLDQCMKNMSLDAITDVSETIWGRYLIKDLFRFLDDQIGAMLWCADQCAAIAGYEKPAANLSDTLYQLRHLRASNNWDEIINRCHIDFGRLTFPKKGGDPDLTERVKAVRNHCKESLKKKLRSFCDPSSQILEDLAGAQKSASGMIKLVRQFSAEYDRAKRVHRILDFGDLEHKTLDLLTGKNRSAVTGVANELAAGFREIMVDEYQDSNAVQDAIFSALTVKRNNLFMVGDVKQSIYQFRLADPTIFLDKYAQYLPAEDAEPGQGRKVMLSRNFRSSDGILSGVNDVFELCMSPEVGGLYYGEDEALHEGIPHVSLDEPEVSLHCIQVQQDTYAEEANFTADAIADLIHNPAHCVRDGEALRQIEPDDIVILLRSPGSVGHHFQNALEERGIRCSSGGGNDLLQTKEIGLLRSILQTINNPRQDIPLISVLLSPAFGFTADELAMIRGKNRSGSIYQALEADNSDKSKSFITVLKELRREARLCTLSQLVERILQLTKLDHICAAMDNGEIRSANLQVFYQMAASFESANRRDLGQFLDHLQSMEDKGLLRTTEPEPGAVTIMSIHKSKGLEFPVVFLCGLSREFNRESTRAQVLCDKELGLGLSCIDTKTRVRYPTVSKRAIAAKITADSISEEMRVLYVAMTRARDRLVMTYAAKNLEKDIADIALRWNIGSKELLTANVSSPGEWVLMAALCRTEAGMLHRLGGRPPELLSYQYLWNISVQNGYGEESKKAVSEQQYPPLPQYVFDQISTGLSFRYPYTAATKIPSKQTATQRKGREKDQEAAENAKPTHPILRKWRNASFGKDRRDPFVYGNAVHRAMQYIRFSKCSDEESVRCEIRRLEREGYLSAEECAMISIPSVAAFFKTKLAEKLRESKNILREFKFSVLEDADITDPSLDGEKVLLQGVVDCAIIESDGIIIIDFKTDRTDENTLGLLAENYRPQVESYASAMEKIYELPVKETYLYFFHSGKLVQL